MAGKRTKIPKENKLLHSKGDKKYDFRAIDQSIATQYIEISNQRLSEFINSLGEEESEKMKRNEMKDKVREILQEDLKVKPLGEEEE